MIVTETNGKKYRHDEEGLQALQAEYPEVYKKVTKNKPEKVEVKAEVKAEVKPKKAKAKKATAK